MSEDPKELLTLLNHYVQWIAGTKPEDVDVIILFKRKDTVVATSTLDRNPTFYARVLRACADAAERGQYVYPFKP